MITLTLPDGSSYAACDELSMGPDPMDPTDDDNAEDNQDLGVLVMRHVKVRKGMKLHLADLRRDEEAERDVVIHLHNRTVRVNGLQIDSRKRDETRCTYEGIEVVA